MAAFLHLWEYPYDEFHLPNINITQIPKLLCIKKQIDEQDPLSRYSLNNLEKDLSGASLFAVTEGSRGVFHSGSGVSFPVLKIKFFISKWHWWAAEMIYIGHGGSAETSAAVSSLEWFCYVVLFLVLVCSVWFSIPRNSFVSLLTYFQYFLVIS